jgi:putative ABC transport system ATP-binding protein
MDFYNKTPGNTLIRFESVSKQFLDGDVERVVLRRYSFDVGAGTTLSLVGPSGSGKTTILNLIAGLDVADSGDVLVEIDGVTLSLRGMSSAARARYRRRSIGYIFQFFNLIPTLTVAENVRLPLELTGQRDLEVEALSRLDALGLAGREESFPEQLSGGEQQRVAIARALAHHPAIILADEPTGNLDAENARRVVDLLCEQVAASGATLVLATHSEFVAGHAHERLDLQR